MEAGVSCGERPLTKIGKLLKLEDGTHCSEAAEIAALQLTDVRTRSADTMRMEVALSNLVSECCAQHGHVSCPLVDELHCG